MGKAFRALEGVKYGLFFAMLFGLLFPITAIMVQQARDEVRPASEWIEIVSARVVSYEPGKAIAEYEWRRNVKTSIVVDVSFGLVYEGECGMQEWCEGYRDVFFVPGEYTITNLFFEEFPVLRPGEYVIAGVLAFQTAGGERKELHFTFEPFVVE